MGSVTILNLVIKTAYINNVRYFYGGDANVHIPSH